MTTAEEIENVLRANSYERDFFVRIETPHGEPALSSKRVTIVDIKKAAQALSEHSTKEHGEDARIAEYENLYALFKKGYVYALPVGGKIYNNELREYFDKLCTETNFNFK